MEITKDRLKRFAVRLDDLLEREMVVSLEALRANIGRDISLGVNPQEVVSLTMRPSNPGFMGSAYTVSYSVAGTGIPIELRVNVEQNYSSIIVKCQEILPKYTPFSLPDAFGNIPQSRIYRSAKDLPALRAGLKCLREL